MPKTKNSHLKSKIRFSSFFLRATNFAPHPTPTSRRAGCTLSCCCPIRHLLVPSWRARLTVAHWYTTAPPLRYHGTIVVVVWCTLSCIRAPKFDYTIAGDHGMRRSIISSQVMKRRERCQFGVGRGFGGGGGVAGSCPLQWLEL